MTATNYKQLVEVAKLAEQLIPLDVRPSRMTILMDLESVDGQFDMDWQALLDDPEAAIHDIFGIMRHIDRSEYPARLGGCFVPRCAK